MEKRHSVSLWIGNWNYSHFLHQFIGIGAFPFSLGNRRKCRNGLSHWKGNNNPVPNIFSNVRNSLNSKFLLILTNFEVNIHWNGFFSLKWCFILIQNRPGRQGRWYTLSAYWLENTILDKKYCWNLGTIFDIHFENKFWLYFCAFVSHYWNDWGYIQSLHKTILLQKYLNFTHLINLNSLTNVSRNSTVICGRY